MSFAHRRVTFQLMNGKRSKIIPTARTARSDQSPEPQRTRFQLVLVVGAAALLVGYLAFRSVRPSNSSPELVSTGEAVATSPPPAVVMRKRHAVPPVVRVAPVSEEAANPSPPPTASALAPAQPPPKSAGSTAVAQELITRISQPDFFTGGVSPQKAEELKRTLKQLGEQGVAAVPAIGEYLDRFQDLDFDSVGAGKLVGYSSLRIGLLDALGQIGGPEAAELSLQMLQKTSDAQEIAYLAKALEKQLPPEQFRPAAVSAASEALAQAITGQWDGRSLAPLFELLQKYGDQSVAGVLEAAAGKWNYYATLALAGLPDGAGIPSLVRLAQDPAITGGGNGDFALRPLAQAAMQYPEARAALLDQARLNQIPDRAWPTVAASLGGNYIQYGNQIFGSTAPPVVWNSDQINQRIGLIDQLLGATSSSAGRQALQNARAGLLSRTAQR